MTKLILLGPQRHRVTVGEAVAELKLAGPFAAITAGGQEREAEVEELDAHVGQKTHNLMLHERVETIFQNDPKFREAHREHQAGIKKLQDIYKIRLKHTLSAVHALLERRDRYPEELIDSEIEHALQMVRDLDRHHLGHIRDRHLSFQADWDPQTRASIFDHHFALVETIEKCSAVMIAGGHVAVLLNRIRLLGLEPFLRAKTVLAWSAGAMILGEKVVLFHDSPPQGQGYAEVFEGGLGLYGVLLPLPHAGKRLQLDNPVRVSLLARRFNDLDCLAFETGSRIDRGEDGEWRPRANLMKLTQSGILEEMEVV